MEACQSLFDDFAWNLGQNQEELLAAVAAGVVIGANGGSDRGGEPEQRLIAGQMAVFIIDALEMIQIDQRHGDRLFRSRWARSISVDRACRTVLRLSMPVSPSWVA